MFRIRTALATLTAGLACALAVAATPAFAGIPVPPLPPLPLLPLPTLPLPTLPLPSLTAPARQPACADATLMPDATNLKRVDRATLCLVNLERTKRHLRKLTSQPALTRTAGSFADQLVRERFFDHTAPNGRTMLDRIKATSYLKGPMRRWGVGENIAYGTGELGTPAAIVGAWMRSSGHRHNILNPLFAECGLGVTLGSPTGAGGATYVNDFGQRVR